MNNKIKPLSFELILGHTNSLDIQPMGLYDKEKLIPQMLLPESVALGSLCLISTKHVIKSLNNIETFRFSLEDGDVPKPLNNFTLNYSYDKEDRLVFQHIEEILWLGQFFNIIEKTDFHYKYNGVNYENHVFYHKLFNEPEFYFKLRSEIKSVFFDN